MRIAQLPTRLVLVSIALARTYPDATQSASRLEMLCFEMYHAQLGRIHGNVSLSSGEDPDLILVVDFADHSKLCRKADELVATLTQMLALAVKQRVMLS